MANQTQRSCNWNPHKSIIIYTCISSTICLAVLALALVDRGRATFGLNIAFPIITLSYHAVVLLTHRRLQRANSANSKPFLHPTATTAALICNGTLILLWFAVFGLILALNGRRRDSVNGYDQFRPGSRVTIGIQLGLDSAEGGILTSIATTSATLRVMAHKQAKAAASYVPS